MARAAGLLKNLASSNLPTLRAAMAPAPLPRARPVPVRGCWHVTDTLPIRYLFSYRHVTDTLPILLPEVLPCPTIPYHGQLASPCVFAAYPPHSRSGDSANSFLVQILGLGARTNPCICVCLFPLHLPLPEVSYDNSSIRKTRYDLEKWVCVA